MKRHVGKGKVLEWRFGKIPQSFYDIEMFIMGKSSGKKPKPCPWWNLPLVGFPLCLPALATHNGWVMRGYSILRLEGDKFSFLNRCNEGLHNLEKVFLERTQTKQSKTENPPDGGRRVM